jgi:hypothetical protein
MNHVNIKVLARLLHYTVSKAMACVCVCNWVLSEEGALLCFAREGGAGARLYLTKVALYCVGMCRAHALRLCSMIAYCIIDCHAAIYNL